MLDSIFQILRNIGDFFVSIGEFIVDFFSDLAYFVEFLGTSIAEMPVYLSWLPTSFIAAISSAVAVVVVLRILGR